MARTPSDLRYAEPPRSLRGYDIEETRRLFEKAADELETARAKNIDLEEKLDRLNDELQQLKAELSAYPPPEETERRVGEALVAAAQAADELREQARQDSERMRLEAEGRRDEILTDARERAETAISQAREEADRIVTEGEQARYELQTETERLRTLTDETTANLRSLLLGMLKKLGEPTGEPGERAVAADAAGAREEAGEQSALTDDLHPSATVHPAFKTTGKH